MNWYLEEQGVAQGPFPEPEIEAKVRSAKLGAESLIWHVGLPAWKSVAQLRPTWLVKPEPPAPAIVAQKAPQLSKPTISVKAKVEVEATKPGLLQRLFGGLGKKK